MTQSLKTVLQINYLTRSILRLFWNASTKRRYSSGVHDRSPVTNCLQPSIQKLITSLAQDCVLHLNEEATHIDAYVLETPRVDQALCDLENEFSTSFVNRNFLKKATEKSAARVIRRGVVYNDTVCHSTTPPIVIG